MLKQNWKDLFTPAERKQMAILVAFSTFMGFFEIAGVASMMPVANLLLNPRGQSAWPIISCLGLMISINFLGIVFNWYSSRVINDHALVLSCRLMAYYLKKPFIEFLADDGPAIGNRLLVDVRQYCNAFLGSCISVFSRVLNTVFVALFLIYLNPYLGMSLIALILGGYWLVSRVLGRIANQLGRQRSASENIKFKLLQDTVSGFKEIKLNQGERAVMDEFSRESKKEFDATAKSSFLSTLPRNILEVLGYIGVFSAFLVVHYFAADPVSSVAILAAYGMAGLRLLPTANQIFQGIAQLQGGKPYFESLLAEAANYPVDYEKVFSENLEPVLVERSVVLRDVAFLYPSRASFAVSRIDIEIPKRFIVGLAGATGAGKSTIAELACGLLPPSKGAISIDGQDLTDLSRQGWMGQIGYVPQQVHLFSDTLFKNIACFGKAGELDRERVFDTAKMVGLHDFIISQLPQGYETVLGAGKTQLSGGQKQRLAFARAIYRDPQFLLFDEATSALDGLLEHQILMCVKKLAQEKPILLVGHRPASLKICDRIYFLESGVVKSAGTFSELYASESNFRQMMDLQSNTL